MVPPTAARRRVSRGGACVLCVAALAFLSLPPAWAQTVPQPAGPGVTATAPAPLPAPVSASGGPLSGSGPFVRIPLASSPVVVDGSTTDPGWERGQSLGNFILVNGEHRASLRTECRLLWDVTNLYIGIRCEERDLETAPAPLAKDRDDPAILNEDNVELFLDPVGDRRSYVHLVVGRGGAILDEVGRGDPKAKDWTGIQARAAAARAAWEVEIAIPFAEIGLNPADGTRFTANLCRTRVRTVADGKALEERSSWSLCRGGTRDPSSFGEMVLGMQPVTAAVSDLGDGFGELAGGAVVRLRVDSAAPVSVTPSVTVVGGGVANAYQASPQPLAALDGLRAKRIDIPYAVPAGAPAFCQVQVLDATGKQVLLRTPQMPLEPTWLGPRADRLLSTLAEERAFAATIAAGDPVAAEIAAQVTALEARAKALRQQIGARDVPGSAARWGDLDRQIRELDALMGPLALKCALAKGRTAEEATARTTPAFVLSGRDWMRPASPSAAPDLADVKPRAYCFASPGETEILSALVTASRPLLGCSVSLTDFVENEPTTPATGSFPAAQARVRVVHTWPQAGKNRLREAGVGVAAQELLTVDDTRPLAGPLPDAPLSGVARFDVGGADGATSRQLWINVTVPRGTAPGLYTSVLTVTPTGAPARSMQLLVKVIGLDLAAPRQKWNVFFHNTLAPGAASSVSPAVYRAYLDDIAAQGFSQATISDPGSKLVEALEARQAAGLTDPVLVSMRGVPVDSVGAYVATARRLIEGKAVPEMWFYTLPDPRTRRELDDAIALADAVHASGGKTVTLISPAMAAEHGASLDVPIYSLYDADYQNYVRGTLTGELQPDARPEFYHYVGSIEDPSLNRLLCGFYLEKTHLDGVFVSSYQDPIGDADPWSETMGTSAERPQMLTYPTASGPMGTIQWEAAREGRDDMRYLATLQALMQQAAPYQTSPAVAKALADARAAIAPLTRALQVDWRYDLAGIAPDFYTKIRWQIATSAIALQKALAQPVAPMPVTPSVVAPGAATPSGSGTPVAPPPAGGSGFIIPNGPTLGGR